MQQTFLFYDLETTGLNKCFDQILQFAAIRTDLELNELERYKLTIKLNPGVVLSPYALLTHNITIQDAKQGIPEYEAAKKIHTLMNIPGTISLGYNTLKFDDEFLRFTFYRNLLPPYTHQYANLCSRADIYPMLVMYYLYKTDFLKWPEVDGKISLTLEKLNQVNKLVDGKSHDAMTDVETTLLLAKKMQQEKEIWDYVLDFFDKKKDTQRIAKLPKSINEFPEAIMVDGNFGNELNYQQPVLGLGYHCQYKNQTLWLKLDTEQLNTTTSNSIPEKTQVIRKKLGETGLMLPPIGRFLQYIKPQRQTIVNDVKQWLRKNNALLDEIKHYYQHYTYPTIENLDIDAALYEIDFPTPGELQLCQQFHQATIREKVDLIEQFTNPRLQKQAIRLLARNYPHVLPDRYLAQFEEYLASLNPSNPDKIWQDYRGEKRLTIQEALQQIKELLTPGELNPTQRNNLNELVKYLT